MASLQNVSQLERTLINEARHYQATLDEYLADHRKKPLTEDKRELAREVSINQYTLTNLASIPDSGLSEPAKQALWDTYEHTVQTLNELGI